jgi:hypothetical protein
VGSDSVVADHRTGMYRAAAANQLCAQ